jgi:hypothetical protein
MHHVIKKGPRKVVNTFEKEGAAQHHECIQIAFKWQLQILLEAVISCSSASGRPRQHGKLGAEV